jgi:hypothetical protein
MSIVSPPCPDYTSHCQRFIVSVRLEEMTCMDGTYCGVGAGELVPACCNDIGVLELVRRCGGDLGCIDYYSNSATIFPSSEPDFDFENLKNGFRDYYEYFFLLFACFILIKLLNLMK